VIKALDAASHIILKMVGYVMNFARWVFSALLPRYCHQGLSVFIFYGPIPALFLIGIALLWVFY